MRRCQGRAYVYRYYTSRFTPHVDCKNIILVVHFLRLPPPLMTSGITAVVIKGSCGFGLVDAGIRVVALHCIAVEAADSEGLYQRLVL